MKLHLTRATCSGILLVFCALLPVLHADGPIVARSRTSELNASSLLLPVGTSRHSLLEHVGPPDDQLSPDIWIYWNRRTNQPQLTQGFETLLVIFHRGRVSQFRMVAEAPLRKFVAERDRMNPGALLGELQSTLRPRR